MKTLKNRFTEAPKEGVKGASPQGGAPRYLFLIKNHFFRLISINILMLVFSIPIVTIPAARCGMNRVLIKLVREGNCFVWAEFWKEFKAQIFRALPTGILLAVLLGLSYYSLSLSLSSAGELNSMLFLAIGLLALIIEIVLSSYAFVLFPMLDLNGRDILKNSLALIFSDGVRAISAFGIKAAAILLQVFLFPVGLLLLLIIPAFVELALCLMVNPLAQKYIIEPFEQGA